MPVIPASSNAPQSAQVGEHALPKEPAIFFAGMQAGQRRQRVIERGAMYQRRCVHVIEFEPPQVGQATSPPPCDG